MAQKRSKADAFEALTWDDIQDWAGTSIVSRGRSYQRNHDVEGLARTPSGGLVAWVHGTHTYATSVDIEEGELLSACTCPYGGTCKHAVAVALEYLECVKNNVEAPAVTEKDRRLKLLEDYEQGAEIDDDGYFDEDDEEYGEDDRVEPATGRSGKPAEDALRAYLDQQTKAQLVDLVEELAKSFPSVSKALNDRRELSTGTVKQLVKSIRKEIQELGGEPGWRNDWDGEGYTPDYSGVRDRLTALLKQRHADEVIELGKELLEAGIQQVEMSHDEGETATEISSCLEVVFRAVPQSSLSSAEQILWVVDAELSDDYDLCQGAEQFWNEEYAAADWNIVANDLAQRLEQFRSTKDDDFSRNFRRDRLSDWLIRALENAGREEEIIPVCEREAEKTGSYVRLVHYLTAADRWEEAEHWIRKGIEATQKPWPGIADDLRTALRQIREKERDWPHVAAFAAEDFFREPTLHTFQEMQKVAERAAAWPAVKAAAMHYLETGELPQASSRTTKARALPAWPLPETGLVEGTSRWRPQFPIINTLIDIAIAENRPDDALRWYDQRSAKSNLWDWHAPLDDKVAAAVEDSHPDRALAIWKQIAAEQIARTQPKAYETAAGYLRKARKLMSKLKREKEWQAYLDNLRQANARKRRLIEILDGLAGGRIIDRS